jgi:hypothetical protein
MQNFRILGRPFWEKSNLLRKREREEKKSKNPHGRYRGFFVIMIYQAFVAQRILILKHGAGQIWDAPCFAIIII